jgi:arsenite methyltransferase
MEEDEIKKAVKESYARVATDSSCGCSSASGCGCSGPDKIQEISKKMGYSKEELEKIPEGADLGLGCGNPLALLSLKKGEVVLDLGSGAGIDCFLAAEKVGPEGRVIGVDMTPEMLEKARGNANKSSYRNIEFRLGEIEDLPVEDNSIDVVISNCVINLAPDKAKVFSEAFRVLKSGGRIMVSDIVLLRELPEIIKNNMASYVGCISGATIKKSYLDAIKYAGFEEINIMDEAVFPLNYIVSDETAFIFKNKMNLSAAQLKDLESSVLSIKVSAIKQ